MDERLVINTGPIIALGRIGALPLLQQLELRISTPPQVDAGLLGERGPLHLPAGLGAAFLLALGACSWCRRSGVVWRIAQVAIATSTLVLLNVVWLIFCVLLGYID